MMMSILLQSKTVFVDGIVKLRRFMLDPNKIAELS